MPKLPAFIFDLDGTITEEEILPKLAAELGLAEEIGLLTELTLKGKISFEQSFRLRFAILRQIPIPCIHSIIEGVKINPHILEFIMNNREACMVATGNLDAWIEPLKSKIPCTFFSSASQKTERGLELVSILDKGCVVRELKSKGRRTIAIGESFNDITMLEEADTSIAFAGVHEPVEAVKEITGHYVSCSVRLCSILSSYV